VSEVAEGGQWIQAHGAARGNGARDEGPRSGRNGSMTEATAMLIMLPRLRHRV